MPVCYQWIILSPFCRFAFYVLFSDLFCAFSTGYLFILTFFFLRFAIPFDAIRWHLLRPFQTMRSAIRPSNCYFVLQFILLPDSVHRSDRRILQMFAAHLVLFFFAFASSSNQGQTCANFQHPLCFLFDRRCFAFFCCFFCTHSSSFFFMIYVFKINPWKFDGIPFNRSEIKSNRRRKKRHASKQTHFWVAIICVNCAELNRNDWCLRICGQ